MASASILSDGLLTPEPHDTKAAWSPSSTLSFPFVFLSSVKQHVPKLSSAYRAASGRKDVLSDAQRAAWAQALDTPGIVTPPPSYAEIDQSDTYDASPPQEDEVDVLAVPGPRQGGLKRTRSGIKRKYSRQGLNLLALSAQEAASRSSSAASTSSSSASSTSTPFSRQLYIHALTYLLQGLPDTLTPDEIMSLRSALPSSLDPAHAAPPGGTTPTPRSSHEANYTSYPFGNHTNRYSDPSTSRLHRFISAATVKVFMLISLLVPYIQAAAAWLYTFERQHHVSERMFSGTVYTADMLGKRAVALTAAIWGLNEGKVGLVLQQGAFWVIRGVSGGLCQGVGQGMEMLAPDARRGGL